VLCGYGIDLDAVSGWINTQNGSATNSTNISRGVFGATVGVERLLKLWDKYNIKTTWFIPAHTIESFPANCKQIVDKGHEVGLHGYTHEFIATMSEKQQRDILEKSIAVCTQLTGKKPAGWTAPAWATSPISVRLLEEYGIEYDHSYMDHDCQPYYLADHDIYHPTDYSKEADTWMKPMGALKPSKSVVCIPADWLRDDWPPFTFSLGTPSQGYVDTYVVEKQWKEQFEYYYREYDTFIYPISIHPQVSGRAHITLMHERIIEWINTHEGVEWVTFEQMAQEFKNGGISGASVEGGIS